MENIANEVPSATVELVERVLAEYGDPVTGTMADSSDEPEAEAHWTRPDQPVVTDAQRRTLRAIRDNPEATQRELAELLDVANSTVSNRVNSIEGFEWEHRKSFADAYFDGASEPDGGTDDVPSTRSNGAQTGGTVPDGEAASALTDVHEPEPTEERRKDDLPASAPGEAASSLTDPALVHKVVHACLRSDAITEEEELAILKDLLETGRGERR